MRKTTVKRVAIANLIKKPTVFKAKRVVRPVVTGQSLIDKAVEEMKNSDKEQELLKRELEKPMKQRNKALMEKYGHLDSSKLTDNYPDLHSGHTYDMDIYFPEDDGVKIEDRPKPWYVGMTIPYEGNKFSYRFPIHQYTYHDGQTLYKLDGFNVYVDLEGVIKNDISEYTIFQALTDYHAKTSRNGMVNQLFQQYKIIAPGDVDDDVFKDAVQKNFAIKGHKVFVNSKVSKRDAESKTAPTVTSGEQLKQSFTIDPDIVVDDGLATKWATEKNAMTLDGGIVIPGITKKLPSGVVVIVGYDSLKTATFSTPRYIIAKHNGGKVVVSISVGQSVALKAAKQVNPRLNKNGLLEWIVQNNKNAYDEYTGEISSAAKKAVDDQAEVDFQRAKMEREDAQAKAVKDAADKAKAKKDADEAAAKAAEDAAAKAAEDAAAENAEVVALRSGVKQKTVFGDAFKIIINKRSKLSEDEIKALEKVAMKYQNNLKKVLIVDGIDKKFGNALGNTVNRIYISKGETYDAGTYFAVIEINPTVNDEIVTYIFSGYDSVEEYFNIPHETSALDVVKHIVAHNKEVYKTVMSR